MKLSKIMTIVTVIICMLCSALFVSPTAFAFQKGSTTAVTPLSNNSAYVIFSDTPKTKNMTFKDGMEDTTPTPVKGQELYYEKVKIDGIEAIKIYTKGYIHFSLDKTKFSGKKMLIVINYYDFGPDQANFWLQYSSSDTSVSNPAYKELAIRKTGMEPGWKSVSFLVDDAAFKGSMNYGCDIRIRSGAFNAISKIEVMDYSSFTHAGTVGTYTPSVVDDSKTGRTSYYMDFNGKPAIRPYVTAQSWNYEGTKFIFGSYTPVTSTDADGNTITEADANGYRLYEYDIINNIIRQLDYNLTSCVGGLNAVVSPDNYIYYSRKDDGTGNGGTYRINWLTYEKERLVGQTNSTMNVTNDGKYMSGYSGVRRSLETGVATGYDMTPVNNLWNEITFMPEGLTHSKGHPMINPEYPELLFFCHEGTTNYIHDRLWLTNLDSGESYNQFVQVPYSTTETAETSGHEVWSMDGTMMYWVKYHSDNNVGQSGLMRMDRFGSNREYLNGDYEYWHCSPAGDHVWVAGDTKQGEIAIVNANTYQSYLISKFTMHDWVHPNQPHPHFSFNAYSVSWQMMKSKNGVTGIGWQIVNDITKHPAQRQVIEISDSANVVTCKGSANYTTAETLNGTNYRVAAANCGVYIDIPNEVVKSTNANVSIQVTYLDKGKNPLNVVYTSPVNAVGDLANREDKTYAITKGNTNAVKTATFNLNLNANDACKFRTDFYLTSADGAYISSVKVSSADPAASGYEQHSIYDNTNSGVNQGLVAACKSSIDDYDNTLYHIDEVEKWQEAGITQATVDAAKAAGMSYVTLQFDGAWTTKKVADKIGNTRTAIYAPKNYRQNGSYKNISGNVYYRATDKTITENDNNVTIEVDYLDGAGFNIIYPSTNSSTNNLTTVNVPGGNTNLWKKATINVTDAKISSTNRGTKLATGYEDIKIESRGNEMYISSVKIGKNPSTANAGIVIDDITYKNRAIAGSKTERIYTYPEDGGDVVNGLQASSKDNVGYNSVLYHIDDKSGWQAAGITQAAVDAAIEAGCKYVTPNVDGAWMLDTMTDSLGVTKDVFFAPRNYRPTASGNVNSNVYFRVMDETIKETDNNLIFSIEYLDTKTIAQITYTSTNGLSTVNLPATGTFTWKTYTFAVNDAMLSSTNRNTKLATGYEDIKANGRSADFYIANITIMKPATTSSDAEVFGDVVYSKDIKKDALADTEITVSSTMSTATTVVAYTAVFNSDGTLKQVEKSPYTNVFAGSKAKVTVPDVLVSEGETYRSFIWESNLSPIAQKVDKLKATATRATDGTVTISWDNTHWSGNFFHIYCDGELIGRTRTSSYKIWKAPKGEHQYIIDVVEPYGKTVYRQRGIVVPD